MRFTRHILYTLSLLLFTVLGAAAQLMLRFDHRAAGKKLLTDTVSYQTAAGDSITVSLLQYYISNIELHKTNGEKLVIPKGQSFFLIRQSANDSRLIRLHVPAGSYSAISFLVGIDSLTSTLPIEARTGVLDPGSGMANGEGMYWTWNSGYIFFKMEGTSPSIPPDKTGFREYQYHIGGYGGYNTPTINNIRRVTIPLPSNAPLRMRDNKKSIVHIRFEATEVVKHIDLKQQHHIMLAPESRRIADNYAAAFSYGGTEYPNK